MKTYQDEHAARYAKSLEWIREYADKATKILDVGGESPFTKTLNDLWPGKLVPYLNIDLRSGFVVRGCDLVLAMETIEHIEDAPHDDVHAEWRGTGTHMMLASCCMSLKPGGILFLTTPNPCSITAIHHALNLAPPMIFRPHVREYSPYELDEMIRAVGLEIIRRETLDVWMNAVSKKNWHEIKGFIKRHGYDPELRGEDIFVLCRRPLESKTSQ